MHKELKSLKASGAAVDIIRRVSGGLHRAMNSIVKVNNNSTRQLSFEYRLNHWKFMKQYYNTAPTPPTFDNTACFTSVKNIYCEPNPSREFFKPDWMPSTHPPFFRWTPPHQIAMMCQTSYGTRNLVDGLSVIIFKKWPILRTHLTTLITACWEQRYFSQVWKRATVTLIHKKGDLSDPQNFRPIAFQPVLSKILNSCIRNKLWRFLTKTVAIDMRMQKGFWPIVDGVTEHVELLLYLLWLKKKKRDIFVILLDLKHAFGELHHSLIQFALKQQHVPDDTIELILSQYNGFFLNITAKGSDLKSPPIHVQRGVLQGDTLSPLLFNIVFDSLMSTLVNPQLLSTTVCGVTWGDGKL